jgi:tRNA threonylcarbamoyl adenosine modification protein YjeE
MRKTHQQPDLHGVWPGRACTRRWAFFLAGLCEAGDVITLSGPPGAGKTTFVQDFAEARGVDPAMVSSPTFALVHPYAASPPLFHLDLYRLRDRGGPDALAELGIEEALATGILLVEWPAPGAGFWPETRLDLVIRPGQGPEGNEPRHVHLCPRGGWGVRLHAAWEGRPGAG